MNKEAKEVKRALEILIDNNLNKEQIDNIVKKIWESKQVHYKFNIGKEICYINNNGEVIDSMCYGGSIEKGIIESFNAFPINKKKLAEYIAKKQLLERKLLTYSDINGAEDISWSNSDRTDFDNSKYYIIARLSEEEEDIYVNNVYCFNSIGNIYFSTEKIAEKALKNNIDLIREVLKMQRSL